ncbi:SpoIIE family protein phosphatase [Actinospica sp. MGRD01-02]|uniref:protein-serine/threonine phosphatase n=1 Tax=Actinospica acidithermotolerans TaxID=2828514 RepID=A0A941EH79_9ACTN|nr:SpoIIE family protein phosphatase [Actinospica acidithermotolerans]MBR7830723.1 SpoIIE family protein phosphatase [Actinospica acidithermotolerans]
MSLVTVTAAAGGLLAVLIGAAFAVVLWSVNDMRGSMRAAQDAQAAISQARLVDNLVLDIETGQRGYLITGQEQFLGPWTAASGHFPAQVKQLIDMSTSAEQTRIAQQISRQGESFIHDYSIPVVDAARAGSPSATSLPTMIAGKQRVDAIRSLFDSYTATQQAAIAAAESTADANARHTVIAASIGIGLSVLLIAAYAGYVTRIVVSPVRRAAALATRLAAGDLTARMPRTGTREIGQLETAFNSLAGSLETSLEKQQTAQHRLRLLYDASTTIGTALDVEQTARELADAAVPRFADYATVDLDASVLQGAEPTYGGAPMRRVALSGSGAHETVPLDPVGALVEPLAPPSEPGRNGGVAVIHDLHGSGSWSMYGPSQAARLLDFGMHSLITAPLLAQGAPLGRVGFWRAQESTPFGKEDLADAEELAAKAALAIDNARRYSRERATALTLQRSLLPHRLPVQPAVETAYRYLPTGTEAGVGGDWLDVIPLSGTRVALVLGDVAGHGVHASASMGQLRSAVRTLADVDLPPDELLTHLDDLVIHLTEADEDEAGVGDLSATCLYAIYDPISRRCSLASAGHPLPYLRDPSGHTSAVFGHPGPPLGVGGLPFETTELEIASGSTLALFSDGLVHSRELDIGQGLEELRHALDQTPRDLDAACDVVMDHMLAGPPADDVALLLARTRALPEDRVVTWDIPADPEYVASARELTTRQLEAWQLEETSFITELVVSELVTNAIRYGAPPIQLRLIRDSMLICEVSDGSNTAPHLRRARVFDEGGRGLLLVAQLTQRWGARYGTAGKSIWCEQALPPAT